jgi:hypothetical protein
MRERKKGAVPSAQERRIGWHWTTLVGVLMVKPRTAGTRETRVAAATENLMVSAKGR